MFTRMLLAYAFKVTGSTLKPGMLPVKSCGSTLGTSVGAGISSVVAGASDEAASVDGASDGGASVDGASDGGASDGGASDGGASDGGGGGGRVR